MEIPAQLMAAAQKLATKVDDKADLLKEISQKFRISSTKLSKASLLKKSKSVVLDFKEKVKRKGKSMAERVKKSTPAQKTEEVKEVDEGEEKPLKEILGELREVGERDAKQTRYEVAQHVIDIASGDSSDDAPGAIVRYLINPIGPYGKRPDEAAKPLSIALNEIERQIKTLKSKLGEDHPDVKEREDLKGKLQNAKAELMKSFSTEIGSGTLGIPTSRTVAYKSKSTENLLSKNPVFKNEGELQKALKELDNSTDPEAHKQWCSKFDYDQLLSVFVMYGREASEVMNTEATEIPPGLLNNKIKVLQNNTSLKQANRLFANELNLVMKVSDQFNVFTPDPPAQAA